MKERSVCCVLLLLSLAACEVAPEVVADAAPTPTSSTTTSLAHHQGVFFAAATPEELWTRFQALHANVTPETALKVGRRIDELLTAQARATYASAMSDSLRGLRIDPSVAGNTADNLRHRMLGDSAVARQAQIKRCRLGGLSQRSADRATLDIHDGAELLMQMPAARERGTWRFLPASSLFATYEELFPMPEDVSAAAARSLQTPEQAADALAAILNGGNGWDLYRLFESETKARAAELLAGSGQTEQDFIRRLDREIRALRFEHGRASILSTTPITSTRSRILLRYSDGHREFVDAVVNGTIWRIQMAL